MMQGQSKLGMAGIGALALCTVGATRAQEATRSSPPPQRVVEGAHARPSRPRTLTNRDRSSVIAVALHSQKSERAGRDCSHLVHSIYQRAGFPYPYADSDDLYDGAEGFRRVAHPEAADLVVWHGHVGIVVRPVKQQFFSLQNTGPKIDNYHSRYWKSRGEPRFYRYVKNDS